MILVWAVADTGLAQVTTATLSGRVRLDGTAVPGVVVTASSPALQGERAAVTNAHGDYLLKYLPAGDYVVSFVADGLETVRFEVAVHSAQPGTLDAEMVPEAVRDQITVTARHERISTAAQGSGTVAQATLEELPLERTLEEAVLLGAGTAAYTARNHISIAGAPTDSSLYLMNGVVLNENIFGQPHDLFIEDAVLETTTMTSNIPAEYGRFSGGVVTMVTRSGGNQLSGSFRATLANDSWNGATPLTAHRVDDIDATFEATLGGALWRDRLWFFVAARDQSQSESRQVVTPGRSEAAIPYTFGDDETRLEGKLTGAIGEGHRVVASAVDVARSQTNVAFLTPADLASVDPERTLPITGLSVTYTGVLSDRFFLEGLYSEKDLRFRDSGGDDTRPGASPVYDVSAGVGFNAHLFRADREEKRANRNLRATASWFLSAAGSHDLVLGADRFEDVRRANNYQSATGYLWYALTPQEYGEPGHPLLRIAPYGGAIRWGDVLEETGGNRFTTDSLFVNDTWRVADRWTLNLGLRWDANEGTDAGGARVVDDSRLSPRLSAAWDVRGDGRVVVTGGLSRYVKEIGQTGDQGAAAGQPTFGYYLYAGPPISAGTPDYPTNFDALTAVFDWFFDVYGGPTNTSLAFDLMIPGLTPKIADSLSSPYAEELTLGAACRLGRTGLLRVDALSRTFRDHYAREIVPDRWATAEEYGIVVDQALIVNDDTLLDRHYDALLVRLDSRAGPRWSVGANATLVALEGNAGGAGLDSQESVLEYREYKDPSWNAPVVTDRRLTLRAWAIWEAVSTSRHRLSLSLLQSYWTGAAYGAAGLIDTVPFVGDPTELGYAGNPGPVWYGFEPAGYRTDDITRTDLAISYSLPASVGGTGLELFLQPEVTNLFNENGVVHVDSTVFTAWNPGSGLEPFDPWTTAPVEGVHWAKGPGFGRPVLESDYQAPRTFRVSLGVRF